MLQICYLHCILYIQFWINIKKNTHRSLKKYLDLSLCLSLSLFDFRLFSFSRSIFNKCKWICIHYVLSIQNSKYIHCNFPVKIKSNLKVQTNGNDWKALKTNNMPTSIDNKVMPTYASLLLKCLVLLYIYESYSEGAIAMRVPRKPFSGGCRAAYLMRFSHDIHPY